MLCDTIRAFANDFLCTEEVKCNIIKGPVQPPGNDFDCGLFMLEFFNRMIKSFEVNFNINIWENIKILSRKDIISDILIDMKVPMIGTSLNSPLNIIDNENTIVTKFTKVSSTKDTELSMSSLKRSMEHEHFSLSKKCKLTPIGNSLTSGQTSLLKSNYSNLIKPGAKRTLFTPPPLPQKKHLLVVSPLENINIFSPSKLEGTKISSESLTNGVVGNLFEHILNKDVSFNMKSFKSVIGKSFEMSEAGHFFTTLFEWFNNDYINDFLLKLDKKLIMKDNLWEKIPLIKASLEVDNSRKEILKLKNDMKKMTSKKPIIPIKALDDCSIDSNTTFFWGQQQKGKGNETALYSKLSSRVKQSGVKSNGKIGKTQLRKRSNIMFQTLKVLSSSDKEEELIPLIGTMMASRPNLFADACKYSKCKELELPTKFSPAETSIILRRCGKTVYNSRLLRRTLPRNMFSSERQTIRHEKLSLGFISNDANVEHGYITLQSVKKVKGPDGKVEEKTITGPHPYVKAISIKKYIEFIFEQYVKKNPIDFEGDTFCNKWGGKIIVVVSGDSGGGVMKYFCQILEGDIYPYGLFEGSDTHHNQSTFHSEFYKQFVELLKTGISFRGKIYMIKLLIKGDMKQAYISLGLAGATSTYPNKQDLCHKNHFKIHNDGSPHGPDYCFKETNDNNFNGKLIPRTMPEIYRNYTANVLKNQKNKLGTSTDLKNYQCVKSFPLYPVESPDDVVPAELHVKLTLGKLGVDTNRTLINGDEFDAEKDAHRILIEKKIGEAKEDLARLKERQSDHLKEWQGKQFLIDRLKAYSNNARLERVVLTNHKSKKVWHSSFSQWKCKRCILTKYDQHLTWAECHNCQGKFHLFCLAKTEQEKSSEDNFTPNLCLECKPRLLQVDIHKDELDSATNKIGELSASLHRKENEIISLENEVGFYTSEKVKEFDNRLKKMGVDIQVHFGGAITGNHVDKILNNYEKLVDLLPNEHKKLFSDYYACVKTICKKISHKVWWSDSEIDDFEPIIKQLGQLFPRICSAGGNNGVTPKAHEMVFHLIPFIRKNRTIGLFGEEDTEKAHCDLAGIMRPLSSVRNGAEKLRIGFQRLCLKYFHDSEMPDFGKPKPRAFTNRPPPII